MKTALLPLIQSELRQRLERLTRAAIEAHSAATDPGSKAEGKYDTRSLEASYLAAGQARQVEELAAAIRIFDRLTLDAFPMEAAIDAGALVEVELAGESTTFLLVPAAGGMVVSCQDRNITLLTPESHLYQKLLGLRLGDTLEQPALTVTEIS